MIKLLMIALIALLSLPAFASPYGSSVEAPVVQQKEQTELRLKDGPSGWHGGDRAPARFVCIDEEMMMFLTKAMMHSGDAAKEASSRAQALGVCRLFKQAVGVTLKRRIVAFEDFEKDELAVWEVESTSPTVQYFIFLMDAEGAKAKLTNGKPIIVAPVKGRDA